MIFAWLFLKIKSFFLFFVHLFRRALCCIRKRRHSFSESVPLTHVVSKSDSQNDAQMWSDWGNENDLNKPKTVQDYIDHYRQQTLKAKSPENEKESPDDQLNFFQDMTPKITKQTKVLIKKRNESSSRGINNRLNVLEDNVNLPSELGEWEENTGWDGEQLLDQEAQRVLREQKKLERERRAWEQHQKRLEKQTQALGARVVT